MDSGVSRFGGAGRIGHSVRGRCGRPSAAARPATLGVSMSRPVLWSLYALLVAIWSSTWVAIKIGLEDTPPLLGAGVRFALAGAGLLALAALRGRSLRTDRVLAAILAVLPFFGTYALVYWGEQYVPSGLAAVLFGVLPIYVALIASVALRDEPLRARLLGGVVLALAGLVVAFSESVALGDSRYAVIAAAGCALAPLGAAIGNVATKRRAAGLDALVLNGWAGVGGGVLLLLVSAVSESWGSASWTAQAIGSIAYLAAIGTALAFVTLTRLLAELPAVTISFIALLLPFGALVFGAVVYDEPLTLAELIGAALVAAGIAVAQLPLGALLRRRAAAVTSRAPG
jgi:drug/metabolite transporter (DMT)-like permease